MTIYDALSKDHREFEGSSIACFWLQTRETIAGKTFWTTCGVA
jgi:hypothetical protein